MRDDWRAVSQKISGVTPKSHAESGWSRKKYKKCYGNNFMKIVICGSMSASKEMMDAKAVLEGMGHSVVVPKNTELYASGSLMPENAHESTHNKIEYDLIRGYYDLIDGCDTVLVVNADKRGVKNYVGGNTFLEAAFAHVLGKKLYFMNDIPEMSYSDELAALQPEILMGDVSAIGKS